MRGLVALAGMASICILGSINIVIHTLKSLGMAIGGNVTRVVSYLSAVVIVDS